MRIAILKALLVSGALALALPATPLHAQPGGRKPLRLITPLEAGGALDVVLRSLGQAYTRKTGQPVIVDNRPGANTIIAADLCAHAPPDGDTLCVLSDSTTSLNPSLFRKLPYDPLRSFEPVTQLAFAPQVLVMVPSVPAGSTGELVAWSTAHPHTINYASFGAGSNGQLVVEWLKKKTGADFTHIPYKGAPPAIVALGAGDVHLGLMIIGNPTIVDQINDGKLKGLMVTGTARNPLIPSVPTFGEAGFPMKSQLWFGVFAPAGTPQDTVHRLGAAISEIVRSPDFQSRQLTPSGFVGVGSSPEEFSRFVREDAVRGKELVKVSGVVLD